jgi:hypothetical protein
VLKLGVVSRLLYVWPVTLIFPRLPDCELAIVCTVASLLGAVPAQKAAVTQEATRNAAHRIAKRSGASFGINCHFPTRVLSIQVPFDVVLLPFVASNDR